jgi:hypothetical protein
MTQQRIDYMKQQRTFVFTYTTPLFLSLFFLSLLCVPLSSPGLEAKSEQTKAPATEPAPKQAKRELRFVFLTRDNGSDLLIRGDVPFDKRDSFVIDSPPRLVLDIPNAFFRRDYQKIAVNRPELKAIRIAQHKDKVRFVFDLSTDKNVRHKIQEESEGLRVIIETPVESNPLAGTTAVQLRKEKEGVLLPKEKEESPVQPEKPEQAAIAPQKTEQPPPPPTAAPEVRAPGAPLVMDKTYKGKKITVSITNASLRDFVAVVAQMSGVKIDLAPDVQERITLNLTDVPWDQALDLVANCYGLEIKERAGVFYLLRPEKETGKKQDM